MIFFALEALAQRGAEGQGIVANAVLLGAACPNDAARWEAVRNTVAGRLVNGFSTNDWVLGFLYRYNCINSTPTERDFVTETDCAIRQ